MISKKFEDIYIAVSPVQKSRGRVSHVPVVDIGDAYSYRDG